MRSYKVYGIKDGGAEKHVTTVHSADEGKLAHQMMKTQGYWNEMVVRDALGGKVMQKNLKETVDTA
jgi:hypothetical protein